MCVTSKYATVLSCVQYCILVNEFKDIYCLQEAARCPFEKGQSSQDLKTWFPVTTHIGYMKFFTFFKDNTADKHILISNVSPFIKSALV